MRNAILHGRLIAFGLAVSAFGQTSFDTPEDASQAAIAAAAGHDPAKLSAIFGPQGASVLTSGNPAQDRAEQSEFARLARSRHQIAMDPRNRNRAILTIGDEDWPFPVPLVHVQGKWRFDSSQAQVEMQARHIGTDELDAIEVCAGYVEAQRKYAAEDRDHKGLLEYASHAISTPGTQDGLYWDGSSEALVPRGFAEAVDDGQGRPPKPYHGYYFRVLFGQGDHAPGGAHSYLAKKRLLGGFGLVAWPAKYGVTGIHTFIVNQDGVVFEKDIPLEGAAGAPAIHRYDPDPSWTEVE